VRPVAAQVAQEVAAEVEALGGEQLLGALVGELVPLQLEEQQLRLDRGAELARPLDQGAPGRVGRVEREAEHRVRARPPGQVLDSGQLVHGFRESLRAQLRHLPVMALGEGDGPFARLLEQLLDARRALPLDERLEVPGGGLQGGIDGGAHCG
jgi:hypothetical protein